MFLGLLSVIFILVYPYITDSKLFLGGDNADYYILATAMSKGLGYSNYHLPGMPPANHFPPGYPFLLSLLMRFGITAVSAMKMFNGILLLSSSFLMFFISKRLTKNTILALIVSLLVILNSNLLEYSTIMMSEISFVFFSLLSVFFFLKLIDKNFSIRSPYLYLTVICIVFDIYIRTQGIALLFAFIAYLLIIKQFRTAIIFAGISIICLAPWQIRSSNLGGSSYMKQLMRVEPYNSNSKQMEFTDWLNRIQENSSRYISKEIPNALFPKMKVKYKNPKTGKIIPAKASYWFAGFLIIALTLLGIWRIEKFRWLLLILYASTFGIYMLWPQVWFGIRFILPMVPLTYLFSIVGVFFILELLTNNKLNLENNKVAAVFGLLLLIQVKPIQDLHKKSNIPHPKNWSNFLLLGEWCNENLEQDAVIANRKPGLIYATSQRKTAGFLYTNDRELMINDMKKNKVTHVILEQLGFSQTGKFLYPLIQKEPDKYTVIKEYGAKKRTDANGNNISPKNAVWLLKFNPELGYNGVYKDGLRNGKGSYVFKSGAEIRGNWINDTLEGPAILTELNGNIITGNWVKGKKEGRFIIEQTNGNRIEAWWENDVLNPTGHLLDKNDKKTRAIKLR